MKLNRPDGRIYDGDWVNGKQHGVGLYTAPGFDPKLSEWKEGKRVKWINS